MENVVALIPPVGAGVLFYFVVRALIRADRTEREAVRRLEEREEPTGIE